MEYSPNLTVERPEPPQLVSARVVVTDTVRRRWSI
jgi:hypothetical protein